MNIQSIWIENEVTLDLHGDPHNPLDTNSDVIVTMTDASRWVASFFSYANITSLVASYRRTGEFMSGRYFWSSDMILVERVDRPEISAVIARLITDGDFTSVFACCPDVGAPS